MRAQPHRAGYRRAAFPAALALSAVLFALAIPLSPNAASASDKVTIHCNARGAVLNDMLEGDWQIETLATRTYLGEQRLVDKASDFREPASIERLQSGMLAIRVKSKTTPLTQHPNPGFAVREDPYLSEGFDLVIAQLDPVLLQTSDCGGHQALPQLWFSSEENKGQARITNHVELIALSPGLLAGVQLTTLQNAPDLPPTRILSALTMRRPQ